MKQQVSAAWSGIGLIIVVFMLVHVGVAAGQQGLGNPTAPIVLGENGPQPIRVVPMAAGLANPWSLAFLPDGRTMLVTERAGRLRVIRDGVLSREVVWETPDPPASAAPPDGPGSGDRLHFMAVHPRFTENQLVYLSYPKRGELGETLAVVRGRFENDRLVDVEEIFVADAWETGGNLAGRLFFGPDEMLYVTVGDRDRICCNGTDDNSLRMKAQSLDNHVGKVLRLRDDGTVPDDNPFVGNSNARPEIFTYGHRNTYGLAIHPETGELWQAEIGPLGGDEINILHPGRNYGWPLVSMGRNYTGTLVSEQPWFRPGMENPRVFFVPAVSPSSIIFYTGEQFPAWKNSLVVGELTSRRLQVIMFNQPSQAERRVDVLAELGVRVRDVKQGPDGNLYVATELGFGGSEDGTVLRIEPAR